MRYDGIIFDWAGTVVDYGCFAPVKAFEEAFGAFGIQPVLEEIRKPMGMLKIDHIRTMFSMNRIAGLWKEKYGRDWNDEDVLAVYRMSEKKILEVLEQYTTLKPYVKETVETLRGMGLKIGSTTGYTDEMMAVVTRCAKEQGYAPDCWFSPDSTGQMGRPYPYMAFKNMETLKLKDVSRVMKVGDTVSDILEGKNAGMTAVGIIQGSSAMGLSMEEYKALPEDEKERLCDKAAQAYLNAGADHVIMDIRGVLDLI